MKNILEFSLIALIIIYYATYFYFSKKLKIPKRVYAHASYLPKYAHKVIWVCIGVLLVLSVTGTLPYQYAAWAAVGYLAYTTIEQGIRQFRSDRAAKSYYYSFLHASFMILILLCALPLLNT